MVTWEVWVSTLLVLFGAITGVSWNVGKITKEAARDLKGLSREIGELRTELQAHSKASTVPCPLHDSINKAIEANEKLVHEHQKFHLEHTSSKRLIDGRADQDTYYGEQKQA